MTSIGESPRGNHFTTHRLPIGHAAEKPPFGNSSKLSPRNLSPNPPPDPMDTAPSPRTAPATTVQTSSSAKKPVEDRDQDESNSDNNNAGGNNTESNSNGPSNGASGSSQNVSASGPKVVQTAFVHKLYSMLEDQSIQHLISWSSSGESFVMSPSTEFSKVLASYFKHTNISSFVRQLNMYGFHKVSDVFHTGSPDSPLWEFKHGGGNFNRGDLVGLREIKRRASRHTLIHRDSFSTPSSRASFQQPAVPPAPQHAMPPQPAAVPVPNMPPQMPPAAAGSIHRHPTQSEASRNDHPDRPAAVEYSFQDIYARLALAEESFARLYSRCRVLSEGLAKCHQWSGDLAAQVMSLVPDADNKVHKNAYALHNEIAHHIEALRVFEQSAAAVPPKIMVPRDAPPRHKPSISRDPVTTSPRMYAFDPARRPSLQVTGAPPASFKPPMHPSMLNNSPQRSGDRLNVLDERVSPASSRVQPQAAYPGPGAPQGASQHLNAPSSPTMNLGRRHTAADIHSHGWQGGPRNGAHTDSSPPHASGQASAHYQSSPYRKPSIPGDQQIRDTLAQYELPRTGSVSYAARQSTPPAADGAAGNGNGNNEAGWQLPGPRVAFGKVDFSGAGSRRTSMANLLNPADGAEDRESEDRKRKRVT